MGAVLGLPESRQRSHHVLIPYSTTLGVYNAKGTSFGSRQVWRAAIYSMVSATSLSTINEGGPDGAPNVPPAPLQPGGAGQSDDGR